MLAGPMATATVEGHSEPWPKHWPETETPL